MNKVTVFRISTPPAPMDFYAKYGIPRSTKRDNTTELNIMAWENVRFSFSESRSLYGSRYSDGKLPVLYTALDFSTAKAEKGFWVRELFLKKDVGLKSLTVLSYHLTISGKNQSLVGREQHERELVHPTDYSLCQRYGSGAFGLGLDYLLVPSARLLGGVNAPIFKLEAVNEVVESHEGSFLLNDDYLYWEDASGVQQVQIDDVFSKVV
jgi:RES domain